MGFFSSFKEKLDNTVLPDIEGDTWRTITDIAREDKAAALRLANGLNSKPSDVKELRRIVEKIGVEKVDYGTTDTHWSDGTEIDWVI